MTALLTIRNLRVQFGNFPAVDGVDLTQPGPREVDQPGPGLDRVAGDVQVAVGAAREADVGDAAVAQLVLEGLEQVLPGSDPALRLRIEQALATLPVEQREAFLLKHVEEMEYDEMATLTGVGVSALKMRVKRAVERLREQLEGVLYV